jgi:hypothetical protein
VSQIVPQAEAEIKASQRGERNMAINIMKKSNRALALVLVLLIPFAAIAITPEDEVTIRVMERHEKSTSSVMDKIALPDAAVDKLAEKENERKRLIEHNADGEGEGSGENAGDGIGEMDRDLSRDLEQIQNQDQDREEMELAQDQIRDSVPGPENKPETGNGTK